MRASGKAGGAVLTGDPVEILLFLYGRTADAHAVLSGDPDAVAKVQQASFGI